MMLGKIPFDPNMHDVNVFLILHKARRRRLYTVKKYPVIIIFLITMLLVCGETVMAKERLGKPLGVLANGVERSSRDFMGTGKKSGWV